MKWQLQVITLVLSFPVMMFGQNKFSVGLNLNSEITNMKIDNANSATGIREKGAIGYGLAVGLQIQYQLNSKLFARSGAQYQHLTHRHKIEGLRFSTDINGTESYIRNDITLSSVGIPLDIGYRINPDKGPIRYLVGLGALANINVNTKSKATVFYGNSENDELTDVENQVDESPFSIGVFAGIEFGISDKLIMGIEPNVRITPNKFTLYLYDSTAKTTLETGLTMRISLSK